LNALGRKIYGAAGGRALGSSTANARALAVFEHGKLVGIVTRPDLVSAFSRPDEEIALDIRDDVLFGTFWITPRDVDVTVRNGEVSLRGTVESGLLTQLLPEAVQRVPGVVSVKSRLVAQPSDATPADVGLFRRI
jgi:CBS domain-containing protein